MSKTFTSGKFLVSVIMVVGLFLALAAGRAEASNWYVSPSGNNTTGTSWQTAWTGVDQIKWAGVVGGGGGGGNGAARRTTGTGGIMPGDTIYIDGGSKSITYQTTLTLPQKSFYDPAVIITNGQDAGRNGRVIFDGTNSSSGVGIDLEGTGIKISATSPGQIVVRNFQTAGIITGESSGGMSFNGLEIANNNTGIKIQSGTGGNSGSFSINNCIIHDNTLSVSSTAWFVANFTELLMSQCWIYNSSYPQLGKETTGVSTTSCTIQSCIFGPGLSNGVLLNAGPSQVTEDLLSNCLFIDASAQNIGIAQPFVGAATVNQCTSYMTSLNNYNKAHECLQDVSGGTFIISSSVFFGGVVKLPSGNYRGQTQNVQWGVTGNTTALAPSEIDPQFNDKAIYSYTNAMPIARLAKTNFSLNQNGPAAGLGANITSIPQLLKLIGSSMKP